MSASTRREQTLDADQDPSNNPTTQEVNETPGKVQGSKDQENADEYSEEEEEDEPNEEQGLVQGSDEDDSDRYSDEESSTASGEEWSGDMEEPEMEFDEMGLELAAQDDADGVDDKPASSDWHGDAEFSLESSLGDKGKALVHWSEIEAEEELAREEKEAAGMFRAGAITPDGLIDEDFEEELGSPSEENHDNDPNSEFRDIAKYGIVQVAGDDTLGRKVIVFSACRLPPSTELCHQKLLQYLKHTLDQYVENDYTLVYFHHGLNSKNKPSFRWLRQAYREFDRKYKKNLKALYLVHPTNFIKIIWGIFRPLISVKFGRKVMYVNYLHELAQHIQLDQLIIPQRVKEHDAFLLAKNKPQPVPTSIIHAPPPSQQFGVSIQFIKEHNQEIIPPVVQQCCMHIRDCGMDTLGIFRRSANANVLKDVQQQFNSGKMVQFQEYGDVHLPAALLKSFLRQLPEPIMTYDLYDHTVRVQSLDSKERLEEMKRILHDELPDDNYYILKYIVNFLTEVESHAVTNKMTAQNLAIVFGPNLMWSKSQASLTSMGYVNACALLLILHYDELFTK